MASIVLDTETTGLDRDADRVVELGVISYEDGGTVLIQRFNPGRPIPPEVTAIHGITDDDVADKPAFSSVADRLVELIEGSDAVIGYNPFFDQGMIDSELARAGRKAKWPLLVCAKRIWDVYEPREERHLHNAFRRFVDKNGFEKAHSAMADVHATRQVLLRQMEHFGLEGTPWHMLDPEQRFWFGSTSHVLLTQEGALTVNFGKNRGKEVAEVDAGFWRWVSTKDFPDHVLLLALEALTLSNDSLDSRRQKLLAWVLRYKAEREK